MFTATNKRLHKPHVSILFSAVGMLLLTLTGTFRSAATLRVIIRLTTYAVTCATVLVLRRRTSPPEPTFTAPAGQHLAIAALALIAWLFSSSSWPELRRAAGAGAVGLVLYAAFAARRSEVPNESDLTSAGRL